MAEVYIAGVGMTRFGRREESFFDLMAEAAHRAMADAEIPDPDAISVGCMAPEEFVGDGCIASLATAYLGRRYVPSLRAETGTSSGVAAFFFAWAALQSGMYRHTLVVAGEKMTKLPTPRVTEVLSRMLDPYERSYGATLPALAALVTRSYMHKYGVSGKDLALIPVKNHLNASRNPYAHFQHKVTLEEVLSSRVIADPLRLYECCAISDGAAAVILTRDRQPIRVAGIGHGTDHPALRNRASLTSFRATLAAAQRAYGMAGKAPQDIQVAEVHDAFTPLELINLEDLGFYEPGKALRPLMKGETSLEGSFPVNPSGGLKARGHPVGATSLAQIVEIVWQLRGQAGPRQVEARRGLAQSIGGFGSNNWVTILEKV